MAKTKIITVRISEKYYQKIKSKVSEENISISQYVIEAIKLKNFLEDTLGTTNVLELAHSLYNENNLNSEETIKDKKVEAEGSEVVEEKNSIDLTNFEF